jgi:hypothetical protein
MSVLCNTRKSTLMLHIYDGFVFIHDHYAK